MPKLIISDETFLDEELYQKIDIGVNDKVEFTVAHHPIGFEVTSNLPNVQSLNAT